MASLDLQILRDIDRQIAALRTDIQLNRQQTHFHLRDIFTRLQSIERRLSQPSPPPAKPSLGSQINVQTLFEPGFVKILIFIILLLLGNTVTDAVKLAQIDMSKLARGVSTSSTSPSRSQ